MVAEGQPDDERRHPFTSRQLYRGPIRSAKPAAPFTADDSPSDGAAWAPTADGGPPGPGLPGLMLTGVALPVGGRQVDAQLVGDGL